MSMIGLLNPGDSRLAEWDDLVMTSPRGWYCQLSTWLASLGAYGFGYGVLAAYGPNGTIVGGVPFFEWGRLGIRILTSPMGPFVKSGNEVDATRLIDAFVDHAARSGATLVQMQIPASETDRPFALPKDAIQPPHGAVAGIALRVGNVPNQLLLVDLRSEIAGTDGEEVLLQSFRTRTRRDIRASCRSGVRIERVAHRDQLRAAYALIEQNGRDLGYATRSWAEIGPTIVDQCDRGQAVVHVAELDGEPVGAHYGVFAGRRMTYMMGGTARLQPDPKVGHRLHWEVMRHSRSLGLDYYDLTTYGTGGVRFFKEGFNPEEVRLRSPFHVVLRGPRWTVFRAGYERLRRNKRLAASLLKAVGGRR